VEGIVTAPSYAAVALPAALEAARRNVAMEEGATEGPSRRLTGISGARVVWWTSGIHPRGAGDRAVARLVFAVAGVKASASEGVGDGAAEPTLLSLLLSLLSLLSFLFYYHYYHYSYYYQLKAAISACERSPR